MIKSLVLALLLAPAAATAGKIPSFSLETPAGDTVQLPRDQQGVDIYLFWATWCPYCEKLMPHLQSIEDEYGDRVHVFAIDFRDDGDPAKVLSERGYGFTLLLNGDDVAKRLGIHGTPGLLLVDGNGNIRFNLYDLQKPSSMGLEGLGHAQRAARLAPWWAARIRQSIDDILGTDAN